MMVDGKLCRLCVDYIYIHTFVTLILQKMYWDVLHSDVFWNKIRSKTLFQGLVAGVASRCTLVACRQRRFGRFGFTEKMDLANLEISAKKKRSRTRSRRSRIWRCKRSLRTSHWRWSTGVVGIFTGLETKKTIENWRMKVMKAQHIFSFFFWPFRRVFSVVSPRSDNSSVWPWLKAGHVCRHSWFVTSHASVIVALCWTCQGTSLNLAFWNVYWILVSLFGRLQNFGRCVFNFHKFHGMSNVLTQKSAVNMPKSWEKLFVQAETWCFVAQSCQSHRCSMRIWYSQAYTIPPEESIGILPKFISGWDSPWMHVEDMISWLVEGNFKNREIYRNIDSIRKSEDWMFLYKLNVFHWHLTDDEGWRLEIQSLPNLTLQGAFRGRGHVIEPQYGGNPRRPWHSLWVLSHLSQYTCMFYHIFIYV